MDNDVIKIYVVFSISESTFKRIMGKFIEWIDGVPFTHVSILVENIDEKMIYESVFPRSKKVSVEDWKKHYKLKYIYQLPSVDVKLATSLLEEMRGKEYSIFQLILIAVARAFNRFQRYFGNNINGTKRLICSELVAEFIQKSYNVDFKENIDFISLKDVWDLTKDLSRQRWEK